MFQNKLFTRAILGTCFMKELIQNSIYRMELCDLRQFQNFGSPCERCMNRKIKNCILDRSVTILTIGVHFVEYQILPLEMSISDLYTNKAVLQLMCQGQLTSFSTKYLGQHQCSDESTAEFLKYIFLSTNLIGFQIF